MWPIYHNEVPSFYQSNYRTDRTNYWEYIAYQLPSGPYSSTYRDVVGDYWYYMKDSTPSLYTSNYLDGITNYWSYIVNQYPNNYLSSYIENDL